jgi:putative tryptophan/tyrosine transport system substrate-binding protein
MRRREFIAGLVSAAAWPLAARAQQPAMPVIGFLSSASAEAIRFDLAGFHQGLRENGYFDGRNVAMEYRWAEGRIDRLPAMAVELVRRPVAVIFANLNAATLAAKAATSTIPVVFVMGGDPIKFGVVASLNRPGGNMTGAALLVDVLIKKRLELLHQLVPTATTIAFLVNPTNPDVETRVRDAQAAAVSLSVQLPVLRTSNPSEIESAFASLAGRSVGAVLVQNDPYLSDQQSDQIVALAARHRVPAGFEQRKNAEAGALMSYGADRAAVYRQVGTYAARVLNGEKPAELPVQRPTKFQLVINMKTAAALGLTIPETLLATADEVIQ